MVTNYLKYNPLIVSCVCFIIKQLGTVMNPQEQVTSKELSLVSVTSPVTHCSDIMEQAIGTVGLRPVRQIVFRDLQVSVVTAVRVLLSWQQ
jgi:hypothetical protein